MKRLNPFYFYSEIMTTRIWNLAKDYPALARTTAIAFYGAVIWLLTYVWNSLMTGELGDYKLALGSFILTFLAGVVEGIKKMIRDAQKEL